MNDTSLRKSVIFFAGSVLSGVLIALLLLRLWPQLASPARPPPAPESLPAIVRTVMGIKNVLGSGLVLVEPLMGHGSRKRVPTPLHS